MTEAKRERLGWELFCLIRHAAKTEWSIAGEKTRERYRAAAEKLYTHGYDAAVLGVEC